MHSSYRASAIFLTCLLFFFLGAWVPDCLAGQTKEVHQDTVIFCSTKRALSQVSNEREVMSALNSLVEVEMPRALGFEMKMQICDSDAEMYQKVARKQADLGCGHLTPFLAQYKRGRVKPIIWFYQEGKEGDRYCLILRKSASYSQAGQLRGLILGYNDPQDLAKLKYSFFRRDASYAVGTFFSKTTLYHNTKDLLYSLKLRRVDVIFDSQYTVETALNLKSVKGEFKIINSNEVMADLPIFIRADLEPDKLAKVESVKRYFVNMHKTSKTQFLLKLLGCDEAREVGEEQEKRYQEWIKKYTAMGLM